MHASTAARRRRRRRRRAQAHANAIAHIIEDHLLGSTTVDIERRPRWDDVAASDHHAAVPNLFVSPGNFYGLQLAVV
jgi:hypothetical protein